MISEKKHLDYLISEMINKDNTLNDKVNDWLVNFGDLKKQDDEILNKKENIEKFRMIAFKNKFKLFLKDIDHLLPYVKKDESIQQLESLQYMIWEVLNSSYDTVNHLY